MQFKKKIILASVLPLMALLLPGCSNSEPTTSTSAPDPKLAYNSEHKSPSNWKIECFGRSLVDLPGDIEWALTDPKTPYYNGSGFTDNIYQMNDTWHYEGVTVSVTPKVAKERFDRAKSFESNTAESFVMGLQENKESIKRLIVRLSNPPGSHEPGAADAVKDWKKELRDIDVSISKFREVDLKLPESYARTRGNDLVAYLWRNSRVYRFASSDPNIPFAELERNFLKVLSRFRVRDLYEIPSEPGVCFPYGFIADRGTEWYKLKNTFRLTGVPNVTYTLAVGMNGDSTEPIELDVMASSVASAPGIIGAVANKQLTRRFIPKKVRIGAINGSMGGFSIKPDVNQGDEQEQTYHVFAGIPGEPNSSLFPFVTFEMNSYRKEADPSLKQAAPPFEQSQDRMLGMMKSIRLRSALLQR